MDLRVCDGTIEHDARGAELLAPMDQGDFACEAGEEERLFHRRVAAADHGDLLAGEKEAVAGGARADTVADQGLLGRQPEPPRRCAAGNDQRARVKGLVAEIQRERVLRQIGSGEMSEAELRAETRGLLAHVLDQLRTLDAFRPARKVLHQGRDRQLPAGLMPLDHQRMEVGACCVDSGGEPGATRADDDGVANVVCHVPELSNCTCAAALKPPAAGGRAHVPEMERRARTVPN